MSFRRAAIATRRVRVLLVGLALGLVGALGSTGSAAAQTPPPTSATQVPTATLVDKTTPKIVLPGSSSEPLPGVAYLAVTPNAVWVTQHRSGDVYRVDPRTNDVVAKVHLDVTGCDPTGSGCIGLHTIAADRRDVWVLDNQALALVHIDARTNRVVGSVPTDAPFSYTPVVDHGGVWAALSHQGDVVRIDARTNKVTTTVHVGAPNAVPVAVVGDTLWARSVGDFPSLHRIDAERGTVMASIPGLGGDGAVVVDGDLWLYGCAWEGQPRLQSFPCPTVKRVDGRTGKVEAEVFVDGVPFDAARSADGRIFVRSSTAHPGPQWITAIDTTENRAIARYDLDPNGTGEAGVRVGRGSLWVADWDQNAVYRVKLPAA